MVRPKKNRRARAENHGGQVNHQRRQYRPRNSLPQPRRLAEVLQPIKRELTRLLHDGFSCSRCPRRCFPEELGGIVDDRWVCEACARKYAEVLT